MSTWTKGAEAETLYCHKLRHEGWTVRRFPKMRYTSRLNYTGQDLWGVDIVAKKDGKTLWVQVKSKSSRMPAVTRDTLEELRELCLMINPESETVMWAGYNAGTKEWKELVVSCLDGEMVYESLSLSKLES